MLRIKKKNYQYSQLQNRSLIQDLDYRKICNDKNISKFVASVFENNLNKKEKV